MVPAALAALPDELASEARDALADAPVLHTADVAALVRLGSWTVAVTEDGPVAPRLDCGRAVADAGHPVGRLVHQAYAEADYDRFLDQYIRPSTSATSGGRSRTSSQGGHRRVVRGAVCQLDGVVRPGPAGAVMMARPGSAFSARRPTPRCAGGCRAAALGRVQRRVLRALGFEVCWQTKHANRLPEVTTCCTCISAGARQAAAAQQAGAGDRPARCRPGRSAAHLAMVGEGVRWVDGPRLTSLDAPHRARRAAAAGLRP